MTMPIELIPDWQMRLARQDAFWDRTVLDRPPVHIVIPKSEAAHPWPEPRHATLRDRWLDSSYQAERALAGVMNCDYLGDALPQAYPNLGPEVFSAFFGCELEYGEDTAWSTPILHDWSHVDQIRFSGESFYWQKLLEMTDALLERGRGRFYTGLTDFHPGADAIAALRDPLQLNYDMVDSLDKVKALLAYITDIYLEVYDFFYRKLTEAGQAISTWAGIVSTRMWLVPSNDFSCMISPQQFNEVFLESVAAECRHYEASLYHLDGPAALKHLDSLLAIPQLSAIQWVYGAGNGRASDWTHVYQKVQRAGKGVQVHVGVEELDWLIANLRPEGLWLGVSGIRDRAQAEAVVGRIARWR